MSPPSWFQLVMAAVFSGSVIALLGRRRIAPARGSTLRFTVSNLWMLDQVSRASGAVLRSGPRPDRVVIDLSEIAHLDASSMALLDYACARWVSAGAAVMIEGCERNVAEAIRRRGLPVQVEGKARAKVVSSQTIH